MIAQLMAWQTLLDILVLAAGFFFIYRTLMGLGTWKIVTGIFVALAVFFAASLLDLKGVEWIYRNLSHVFVISLVILFQPELRKFFEKAASTMQLRQRQREPYASLVAQSLWQLAKGRIGALVVIPGREDIQEWVGGGFRLGAQPSIPLILSIFDPNSPGHDGALILRDGKFVSFGVRIPVSQSGRLSSLYGTRHQAAMGLSEKTDALVLAVSEERGQVSVFKKGEMSVMESEALLARFITDHHQDAGLFETAGRDRKAMKAMVLEGAGSLAAAVAFWIILISGHGEMIEKVMTLPVEYTAISEDLVMTGDKAKEVKLHLAGTRSDLDLISPTDTRVTIDLANASPGNQTILVSRENIRLPRGVTIVDVDPPGIPVSLAKRTQMVLQVKPQLVGSLPRGLKVGSMTVRPESLAVYIPSGKSGSEFSSITTTPIYLDGIREDLVIFCKIITPASIQPVDKRWPDVEVRLNLKKID